MIDELREEILKDEALSSRIKRLIAIASAVSIGCDSCFKHHWKIAEKGIKRDGIAEAILVASLVRFGSGVRFLEVIK